ncbi:hypothetical protein MMC19_001006 [Ptychographa xylographoides]|nr:hypothetical protein [Ptychographa xylographoides]
MFFTKSLLLAILPLAALVAAHQGAHYQERDLYARDAYAEAYADAYAEAYTLYERDFYEPGDVLPRGQKPSNQPVQKSLKCDPQAMSSCLHSKSCETGHYVYHGMYPGVEAAKCAMVCDCE